MFVVLAGASCDGLCAHRHGRVELVVDLGLYSFHLSLVQPLGLRVGGWHLVQWHHLH